MQEAYPPCAEYTPSCIDGQALARVRRCEKRIWSTAAEVAQRGGNAVLDLGFMKVDDRGQLKLFEAPTAAELAIAVVFDSS